jgi:hypothetical protein
MCGREKYVACGLGVKSGNGREKKAEEFPMKKIYCPSNGILR